MPVRSPVLLPVLPVVPVFKEPLIKKSQGTSRPITAPLPRLIGQVCEWQLPGVCCIIILFITHPCHDSSPFLLVCFISTAIITAKAGWRECY